jgi:predicted nuclease of restriction endonuclease-like (RecB) superfamily
MNLQDQGYKQWLADLKNKIRSTQIKAAIAVNSLLIEFYWELGKMIAEKQTEWGSKFLETLSTDLRKEFPEMQGFSVTNLKYCRLFYQYFTIGPQVGDLKISPQPGDQNLTDISNETPISQQPVGQIPWGHTKVIITQIKERAIGDFYVQQTLENNWNRDTLALQIKTDLYARKGKAISNFKHTLPIPQSELAEQTLKDPYVFDFMTLSAEVKERDIEKQLTQHITKFLLELGKGFAFIGQQQHLEIAGNDYYIDLLFYHTKLKCYVVIELKNTRFIPEYAGKLNFYLSAVDSLIKMEDDNPTIGILLCREKNNIEAEFALRDIGKPMGVSEFQITENLPDNLKSSLPTIEEIENELKNLEE